MNKSYILKCFKQNQLFGFLFFAQNLFKERYFYYLQVFGQQIILSPQVKISLK
jgi:hypothetical protein